MADASLECNLNRSSMSLVVPRCFAFLPSRLVRRPHPRGREDDRHARSMPFVRRGRGEPQWGFLLLYYSPRVPRPARSTRVCSVTSVRVRVDLLPPKVPTFPHTQPSVDVAP